MRSRLALPGQRVQALGGPIVELESAEPDFDELAPEEFLARFPEGVYDVDARTVDGELLEGEDELSHVLAAPPGNVRVSGTPKAASCDVVPLPLVATPVVISWDAVTTAHPTIGRAGPTAVDRYQLFVEGGGVALAVDLPAAVTSFEVPAAVTAAADAFKFEIIVREASGNNTAVESCYRVR